MAKPTSELRQVLTPARTKSLEGVGITTVFDLLTLFPRRLHYISPLLSNTKPNDSEQQYFFEGELLMIEPRRGRRPYLVLHFQTAYIRFSGYYFDEARYLHAKHKLGDTCQVLASRKNNLWTIHKLEPRKDTTDTHHFILGRADLTQDYLAPVYPKTGKLTSTYLLAVHRLLPQALYTINLTGLVPANTLIPPRIDLYHIHHPETIDQYTTARSRWVAFNVFLKMSLIKYINVDRIETRTRAGSLDTEFLKELSTSLPYTLSPSQKLTIWDLLKDITIPEK